MNATHDVSLAVRGWTEPANGWPERPRQRASRASRDEALVIDVETNNGTGRLDDTYQRPLLVGWRHIIRGQTIEEGLAYPDELPERDPEGFARLVAYVESHDANIAPVHLRRGQTRPRLTLIPLSAWREDCLYRITYRRRATLVGFNLPFDLGALALAWSETRSRNRHDPYQEGFSLSLFGGPTQDPRHRSSHDDGVGHPRLRVRRLNRYAALYRFTVPGHGREEDKGRAWAGRFVDCRSVAYALTGRSHSLDSACTAWGIPAGKVPCEWGVLDEALIAHLRGDVDATAQLYQRLNRASALGDVVLDPAALRSPAGLTDALLTQLGIGPLRDRVRRSEVGAALDVGAWLGAGCAALYAGRAEAHIVRVGVPVVPVDWSAMYPTVCSLIGVSGLLTAEQLTIEDTTEELRATLHAPDLARRLLSPEPWNQLGVTLVEVVPAGERWPYRARLGTDTRDRLTFGPLDTQGRTMWFAWPDVAAAAIHSGQCPEIRRAVRLTPHGTLADLSSVKLPTGRLLDPTRHDLFVSLVEERHRLEHQHDPRAAGLKSAANSLAHGILSRFDRLPPSDTPQPVVLHTPSGPQPAKTHRLERPGPHCCPPVAATVTAGARLMLTLIEHAVADAGGTYAYMDTDSIAIVAAARRRRVPCPGGPHRLRDGRPAVQALSFAQVRDILAQFQGLRRFDPRLVPAAWKIEHDACNQPFHAHVLATKRYALYRETPDGHDIVKASEVALGGIYLDPQPSPRSSGQPLWILDSWRHLIDPERNPQPVWSALPAVLKPVAGSPAQARQFGVRPFAFVLQALRGPFTLSGPAVLATYDDRPDQWNQLPWSIGGEPALVAFDAEPCSSDSVVAQTLGDVLGTYRLAHEPAAEAHTDERGTQAGVLSVRIALAHRPARTIGKETTTDSHVLGLDETDDRPTDYPCCRGCGTPLAGRQRDWCLTCRTRHDQNWRRRHATPDNSATTKANAPAVNARKPRPPGVPETPLNGKSHAHD